MTFIRPHLGILVCCLVLSAPAPSMAATDPAQGAAAFTEGQKLFLAGDYLGALTWFKTGYTQTQDPAFLLNIAQCHRSLGEIQAALNTFKQYLASSPEGKNPEARAVATKAINDLEPAAKTAPPPTQAATVPTASSALNSGRSFSSGPGGLPVLEPLPEIDTTRAAVAVAEAMDKTAMASEKMATTTRRLRVAAMVCGAVGLASSGVGVYYWTRAKSLSDSANKATIYSKADYDDGSRAETMQWIFYGVGGAAVATGVGLFVYSTLLSAPKHASVSLAPMVGPRTTGLAAGGTF